jgi:hypothetical protein
VVTNKEKDGTTQKMPKNAPMLLRQIGATDELELFCAVAPFQQMLFLLTAFVSETNVTLTTT